MFNVLISADRKAWESEGRMEMNAERFLEHSETQAKAVATSNPKTFIKLERITSFLQYENIVAARSRSIVCVGQIHDIRHEHGRLTFCFAEMGRIARRQFEKHRHRINVIDWEMNRTHWAVKEGDVPQDVLALVVPTPRKYDVVLSFAGENRAYVRKVAEFLEVNGVAVFYDEFEGANLWGKDLAEHFDIIYRKQGRFA